MTITSVVHKANFATSPTLHLAIARPAQRFYSTAQARKTTVTIGAFLPAATETKDNCESQCSSSGAGGGGDGGSGSYCDDAVGCQQGEFCNFDDVSSGFCEGCVGDCSDHGLPEEGVADCEMNCP